MIMNGFIIASLLLAVSGLPGLGSASPRWSQTSERAALVLSLGGAILGFAATVAAIVVPIPPSFDFPWNIPGGRLRLVLDGLSAVFLLPAFLVHGLGSLYGLGYWPGRLRPRSGRKLRFFYGLLGASTALLLVARNGMLFLLLWEIMALSGYFLVITEDRDEETRKAGFIYLAATHAGTIALFALFALLHTIEGSFAFPGAASLQGTTPLASAVFLLAILGFGFKAGIMPLHVWLPGAHAAAPSHVSAFLSGIMIKLGIYGIVRTAGFFAEIPAWWGWLVLLLGTVSGIMGVVFAIAQHDIKRLLAYHSVENIGIILLGLGLALLGRHHDMPVLVALGMGGAFLHVINHGLFKSLLFLSAGSVIHATGTRDLDRYGGLIRRLPRTALFFLGGAVAISGLPPMNGFASEWLIYLGLLGAQQRGGLELSLAVLGAPVLALIGGLALACFVKVFGAAFLGEPRYPAERELHESPVSMVIPMAVLLAVCIAIGTVPIVVFPLLDLATSAWTGIAAENGLGSLAPARKLSWIYLMLLLLSAYGARVLLKRAPTDGGSEATWGCGYARANSRMQYTASSFAEPITGLFHWAIRTRIEKTEIRGLHPPTTRFATHTPDTVLDLMIIPVVRAAVWLSRKTRSVLQHGVAGLYMLYIAITLFALLVFVAVS